MKKILLFILINAIGLSIFFIGCENKKGSFVEVVKSRYSTPEGVKKFEDILEDNGLSIFQVIDHAQNAKNENMDLLPETVVVFGNPKMGTIFMQCNQSMGLELPLRMLFYSDYDGNNWISYTNPEYYTLKHNIKDKNCLALISKVNTALQTLTSNLAESNATATTIPAER
ncbi:putative inner membrane or exported protein [hydrothermal vent metagenome]|uniref:Putative inner membrane or exported protein n=1 Tax=hydrothermal vent metagenome TaxID=652676 RepID=A0A1W1BEK2_9ZZZZ